MKNSMLVAVGISGLLLQILSAHAADNSSSGDLLSKVLQGGEIVFLRDEFVPSLPTGTSENPDLMGTMTSQTRVSYQGASSSLKQPQISIDPSKLSCMIKYNNARVDSSFAAPLKGKEVREGLLITGIDASFKAGDAVRWDMPNAADEQLVRQYDLPGNRTSYSINMNFYRADGALADLHCSVALPAGAPRLTIADFVQGTGGLLTLR